MRNLLLILTFGVFIPLAYGQEDIKTIYDKCADTGLKEWSKVVDCGRISIEKKYLKNTNTSDPEYQKNVALFLMAEGTSKLQEEGIYTTEQAVGIWWYFYNEAQGISTVNSQSSQQSNQQSKSGRNSSPDWGAIERLGRDIQSGKAWPQQTNPTCNLDRTVDNNNGTNTCIYRCGRNTRSRVVNGFCPYFTN